MNSIKTLKDKTLIEEVFAILNSCLMSDSGILAVRGLSQMQHFLFDDLVDKVIMDDTYATACHMLRQCLLVRGLTAAVLRRMPASSLSSNKQASVGEDKKMQEDRMVYV